MGEKNTVRVIRYRRLSHDGKASFLFYGAVHRSVGRGLLYFFGGLYMRTWKTFGCYLSNDVAFK